MSQIFWKNLYPQISLWQEKKEKGIDTEKVLLRYAISHIQELIDNEVLAYVTQLSPGNKRGDSYAVYATNNKNSVIGNNIIIKTPKKLNVQKGPIQDTIGSNTYMKNYVKYLIDIYHDFKKANINAEGENMKYL